VVLLFRLARRRTGAILSRFRGAGSGSSVDREGLRVWCSSCARRMYLSSRIADDPGARRGAVGAWPDVWLSRGLGRYVAGAEIG